MPRWAGLGAELWFSMRTGQSNFHARWGNVFHECERSGRTLLAESAPGIIGAADSLGRPVSAMRSAGTVRG